MIYIVTETATGTEVYRYQADSAIEWNGMEFATHTHIEFTEPVIDNEGGSPSVQVFTKLGYLRRFTANERIAIREVATQSPALADYLELLALADEVRGDDPDIIAALNMLTQAGLLAAGRSEEILNG